ncbi:tyrosine-type recombinase/integrase [Shewanella submarina]|nr:tyrosine-type recombinase/integrase [Shewanella submarina]
MYDAADDIVKVAMELAYLCCARQQDILSMRTSQIQDKGIFIVQSETGVEQIKLWTPRLRAVIGLSKTLAPGGVVSTFVLCKLDGGKWSRDGFNSRWSASKERAREISSLPMDFTFHDIKAKGMSDLEGSLQDKQAISGHKHIGQTARYDRKVKEVPVVGGDKQK